jgi:hypothetical protein
MQATRVIALRIPPVPNSSNSYEALAPHDTRTDGRKRLIVPRGARLGIKIKSEKDLTPSASWWSERPGFQAVSTNLAAPVVVQTRVICIVTTALLDTTRKS